MNDTTQDIARRAGSAVGDLLDHLEWNAALIKAAPRMLAALKAVEGGGVDYGHDGNGRPIVVISRATYEEVQAAIKEAEGG